MGRRAEMWCHQDPHPRVTCRRMITVAEVLPEEWVIWAPHQAPQSWGFLHQEDEPPDCLALKANGTHFRGIARGLWKMKTSLLKGTHKISPALGPRAGAVIERNWSEPPADLAKPPGDAGGNCVGVGLDDTTSLLSYPSCCSFSLSL